MAFKFHGVDFLDFDSLLSEEERMVRNNTRAFVEDKIIPIIRNPKKTTADTEAVFYFPGCGSERLFSQVGLATQAMLWHVGVQTVLPPGYLCCGYPQRGSGDFDLCRVPSPYRGQLRQQIKRQTEPVASTAREKLRFYKAL